MPKFSKAAELAHDALKASFSNNKHSDQWINTIKQYANPHIGDRRIDDLGTPDILMVLAPIWLTKPETARRLRQRLHRVFEHAKASGHRSGENPVVGVGSGLPKQQDRVTHHTALPFGELPDFMARLRKSDAPALSRLALELLILTATRTSEVLLARWNEFDLENRVWIIPAHRMKAKRAHRIPLVERGVEIVRAAKSVSFDKDFVFPGMRRGRPLSNVALLKLLERMKVKVTVHGFRSSFSDWAAELTHYPREVVEMALAHTIKNKVEAAYRRGDLLEKRVELMEGWAEFALSLPAVRTDGDKIDTAARTT